MIPSWDRSYTHYIALIVQTKKNPANFPKHIRIYSRLLSLGDIIILRAAAVIVGVRNPLDRIVSGDLLEIVVVSNTHVSALVLRSQEREENHVAVHASQEDGDDDAVLVS